MILLDASVALVSLLGETGHDATDLLLETEACAMSSVNLSEVHARLLRHGFSNRDARGLIDTLQLRELTFDRRIGELAAALAADTASVGLGIADRACLATGIQYDSIVMTADHAWDGLDLPVDVRFVR